LTKELKPHIRDKTASSTNGAGKIGYLDAEVGTSTCTKINSKLIRDL
jgi:hypothetical protein